MFATVRLRPKNPHLIWIFAHFLVAHVPARVP
jgi:hypothetical protein